MGRRIIGYYIASLDYNLILKDIIKRDKKKKLKNYLKKVDFLNKKGTAYQNDIAWLTSDLSYIYDKPDIKRLTYNFVIQPDLFDEYF